MSYYFKQNNLVVRIVAALVFGSLLVPSVFARERQGGIVQIDRKDGITIRGELIAVRGNSLLVEANAMEFSNTPIAEINNLSIKRNSHVAGGVILGLLGGTLLGAAIGYFGTSPAPQSTNLWSKLMPDFRQTFGALYGAGVGALAGGLTGGGIGLAQSSDIVLIERGHCLMTEAKVLKKLRSQAKVPDAI